VFLSDQPEFNAANLHSIYVWPGRKSPVNITCSVDAVPPPTIRWRHRHQWLLDDRNGRHWWHYVYRVYNINKYTSVLQVSQSVGSHCLLLFIVTESLVRSELNLTKFITMGVNLGDEGVRTPTFWSGGRTPSLLWRPNFKTSKILQGSL